MKKITIALTLLAIVVVAILLWRLSMDSSDDQGLPLVRVSVNSWVGFGPLYVAKDRGFFKEEGINVDIIRLESGADRRASLVSERVDILGASLDDFAVTVDLGADAVAFGCADFSNGADGVLVGGDVNSLEDLLQTEIAVQPGLPNHFFLLYALDQAGLSTSDLKIIPMLPDDAGAAFIAGRIDAAVTWEPHLGEAIQQRADAKILVNSSEYPEAILDLFIAPRSWVESNSAALGGFRRAWDRAVLLLQEQPDDVHAILARDLGLEPAEVAGILEGVTLLTNEACNSLLAPKLVDLGARVERLWREAGFLKGEVNIDQRVILE